MKQSVCRPESLSAYLNGSLSENQEEDLILHLEDCRLCTRKLEQLAADMSDWKSVQVLPPSSKRVPNIATK